MATDVVAAAPANAEAVVDQIESVRAQLRGAGRAAMGFTGEDARPAPFWRTLRENRITVYPLAALCLLTIINQFQAFAIQVMAPEISRALGVGRSAIAGLFILQGIAVTLSGLPMSAFVERRPLRALVTKLTAFGWSVATLFTSFVSAILPLAALMVVDGATTGSVGAVHQPLLMDSYPTAVRARVVNVYYAAATATAVAAPLTIALLTGPFDLTWRGVLLVMGISCVAGSLIGVRLRDPGFGRFDTQNVRAAVHEADAAAHRPDDEGEYELRFFEIVRRLLAIPTFRRVAVSSAVVGMLSAPLNTFFSFYLAERWGLDPVGRSAFFAALAGSGVVVILATSRLSERLFHRDPAELFRVGTVLQFAAGAALAVALLSPWFAGTLAFMMVSAAVTGLLRPITSNAFLSVVRPQMRPHASTLVGIFELAVGGIAGLLLLSGIDSRYGTIPSLVAISLLFPAIAAGMLWSAGRLVNADLDRTVDEIIEEEETQAMRARGVHLPMLACRRVDFSYGQLQVLFDVDFSVDDGEMVALLGTNGAGKSTLLRVVSGLGIPSRGSVRFRGGDITFLEPPRRVALGITQVPGGRAVFGPMTVVENLRTYGYTMRRDRRDIERGIEESFDAFPRLAERRNQAASTLSGGEQQMLGLAKALMLHPRLLLIDELSLGLAPKIVAELLAMVRRINAGGTAIVLVEQSVNVALTVAQHAYFMEKGEIRFDGRADDLLARPDLLRSVFLEGAAKGLSVTGHPAAPSNGSGPLPAGTPA